MLTHMVLSLRCFSGLQGVGGVKLECHLDYIPAAAVSRDYCQSKVHLHYFKSSEMFDLKNTYKIPATQCKIKSFFLFCFLQPLK